MSLFDGFDTSPSAAPKVVAETNDMELMIAVERIINDVIPRLSPEQKWKLRCALPAPENLEEDVVAYGANFSIAGEIDLQVRALRAMREHYMPDGKLREGVPIKEFKDFLSTANQMVKMLISAHEEVMNMERGRLVEAATVDALTEMSTKEVLAALGFDPRERFLTLLEEKLEMID